MYGLTNMLMDVTACVHACNASISQWPFQVENVKLHWSTGKYQSNLASCLDCVMCPVKLSVSGPWIKQSERNPMYYPVGEVILERTPARGKPTVELY
jgi:hypothetical protein